MHIALLASVTGAEATVGTTLVDAAQLALSQPGSPVLDVRDTQSTPEGAAAAAQAAAAAGDQLIIGPLSSRETAAVTPIAQKAGIPVLAFTNDPSQAADGVWIMGISPADQFRRLIFAAHDDGRKQIAALLPEGEYGDLVAATVTQAASDAGFPPPDIVRYSGNYQELNQIIRDLADYADRRAPIDAKIKEAKEKHTAEGRKEAVRLAETPIPPPSFDVLVIGATGEELGEIESLLPYYDITADQVRFLGPDSWAFATGFDRRAIVGGWYAASDPALRAQFVSAYTAKYGAAPPEIADCAYDAANLGRVLASNGNGIGAATLTSPSGFAGVDGVFALQNDGHVKRGLAIFQLQPSGGATMVQPSPQNINAPGT